MALDPVSAGIEAAGAIGTALIKHFFPDPAQQAAAEQKLVELRESGELARIAADSALASKQIDVNLQDAKSEHWWQFGWRPAIGWVCVAVLAMAYLPKAIALTAFWSYQCYLLFAHPEVKLPALPPFPDLGLTDVFGILGTLLGAGWMAKLRTDEKKAKTGS